jgi:hypothetical protein
VVFVADDLAAWLIGRLADAGFQQMEFGTQLQNVLVPG